MNERREAGQEEAGKKGFRTCGIHYTVCSRHMYTVQYYENVTFFRLSIQGKEN